jgi:hypothetical protein
MPGFWHACALGAGEGVWVAEFCEREALHQANGLADDPGKGRQSESVRGMEDGMVPSLFVF